MVQTAAALIEKFELKPHPEGGYYRSTYRSEENIPATALPARFSGGRCFSTAIYFLLQQGDFSAFHRIKSDEVWHFYGGGDLNIYVIYPDGTPEIKVLGNTTSGNSSFQQVVPAGCWFASAPVQGTEYSFVGCTVAPGFDFADFELAEAAVLVAQYPEHRALIEKLCRQ